MEREDVTTRYICRASRIAWLVKQTMASVMALSPDPREVKMHALSQPFRHQLKPYVLTYGYFFGKCLVGGVKI